MTPLKRTVALVALALPLAGCAAQNGPQPPQPAPETATVYTGSLPISADSVESHVKTYFAATAGDEQQLRGVLGTDAKGTPLSAQQVGVVKRTAPVEVTKTYALSTGSPDTWPVVVTGTAAGAPFRTVLTFRLNGPLVRGADNDWRVIEEKELPPIAATPVPEATTKGAGR